MILKSKNQLEPGQTYYAVQGVAKTVVNTYVYHPTDEEQICNCEHTKTIANWACFTTKEEADALARGIDDAKGFDWRKSNAK